MSWNIMAFRVLRALNDNRELYEFINDFLHDDTLCVRVPGGRLNKKDGLTRYGDSHVKDKTS